MALKELIAECHYAIESTPLHFLDISHRNKAFSLLGENQCGHLILNTIKHVIPVWSAAWPHDDKMKSILISCDNFLRKEISTDALNNILNPGLTYMENKLSEEKYDAAYVGLSSVYAGYEILNANYIKNTVHEFTEDPSEWSSLLYASLGYSGGTANTDEVDNSKNRIFWADFFLTSLENAIHRPR